ncbi:NAD(P)H-dependent oxidoreductase [Lacinutrix chionoecetis]
MNYIKTQEWRYATKQFDTTKKVSAEAIEKIKQSIQLSASSYGLQPYKILIITDAEVMKQLFPASWNQSQITEASHLIVFCNYTNFKAETIDTYIKLTAKTRDLKVDNLKDYGDFMKSKLAEMSAREHFNWSKHQTYIALANLLAICADLKIDACPMEGFYPETYNNILGLNAKGLNAAVIATIGYRSKTDEMQHLPKVRKPMELLFDAI